MTDWSDPFSEDSDAVQREQRRREREERRQRRLAERVKAAGTPDSAPEPAAEPERSATPEPAQAPAARQGRRPQPEPDLGEPPPEIAPRTPWQARRPPSRPGPPAGRRYRRRRIAMAGVVGALGAVGIFLNLLYQPFHGAGHGQVIVTVPKGASASDIADLLDAKGVVSSSTFFDLRLKLSGKSGDIQAGKYTMQSDMSYGDAIDLLATPPKPVKPKTITVTIPEGYDRTQTADLLKQDGVKGDYLNATRSFKGFDPARYGAKSPANLEGFLFPATYKLKPGEDASNLVAQQLTAFEQNIKSLNLKYASSKNLTPYDVLIIASLIEREAATSSDRPKVAAVIYNRLKQGIPLGIDATIRFVLNDYTHALTQSDLALNSPYNTRTNTGLPPGPIANPGLASLQAAAAPAKVPYLYYVTKPGACGKLTFATTDAEFQRLVDQYNSARAAAGGKSPTSC